MFSAKATPQHTHGMMGTNKYMKRGRKGRHELRQDQTKKYKTKARTTKENPEKETRKKKEMSRID